jgi:hypothetical protein
MFRYNLTTNRTFISIYSNSERVNAASLAHDLVGGGGSARSAGGSIAGFVTPTGLFQADPVAPLD